MTPSRTTPLLTVLAGARERLDRWSRESQRRACANARTASAALAEIRAERDDVEAFLAAQDARQPSRGNA
ncbi:hypothetical protein GCM10022215_05650 [Nocardioides fonticola]|uniref:Uncharacterized protein n=1 Tax=Nocardioides fonticola TaxID=450363 RepID=A0ABP7XCM9_9ACTN